MKQYFKNPNLYYIAAPVFAAVWALSAWLVSFPSAQLKLEKQNIQYEKTQVEIEKILKIAPDRLNYKKHQKSDARFDYTTAIDYYAKICSVPSSAYSHHASPEIKRKGQITKTASVSIKQIEIEKFAKFLSMIMLRWPDLQCDSVTLVKLKGKPDSWKTSIKFTYFYKN